MSIRFRRKTIKEDVFQVLALEGNRIIGSIFYNENEILELHVSDKYRRRGIGKKLWNLAGRPPHSPCRTSTGDLFARSVGGTIPPLHQLPCKGCKMK